MPFMDGPQVRNRKRIRNKPASVIASEPNKCTETVVTAQAYCWRRNKVTVSAEKVENVVRPPQKPVVTNRRSSGDRLWNWVNTPSAQPMMKPPSRLAASVPSGRVGSRGLNQMPNNQRSTAPAKAPIPMEKTEMRFINLPEPIQSGRLRLHAESVASGARGDTCGHPIFRILKQASSALRRFTPRGGRNAIS